MVSSFTDGLVLGDCLLLDTSLAGILISLPFRRDQRCQTKGNRATFGWHFEYSGNSNCNTAVPGGTLDFTAQGPGLCGYEKNY